MSKMLTKQEYVRLEILKALIAANGEGKDLRGKTLSANAKHMARVILETDV